MEPNNSTAPKQTNPAPDDVSGSEDLRAEGIDIVGQGVPEDNEFTPENLPGAKTEDKFQTMLEKNEVSVPDDRTSNIAFARSQFEAARLVKDPAAADQALQKPTPPPAPAVPPAVPQASATNPSAPELKQPEVSLPPIKPPEFLAPKPVGAEPTFQRMSFGVAPAMPKAVESEAAPSLPKTPAEPSFQRAPVRPPEPAAEPSPAPKPPLAEAVKEVVSASAGNPSAGTKGAVPFAAPLTYGTIKPSSFSPAAGGIKNDPSIKPLRTFKSDAEEAVRYQNVSAIDIAVAEQKKREVAPTAIEYEGEKKSSGGLFIIIVIALLVLIGGGWYYWYSTTSTEVALTPEEKPETKVETVAVKTIVPYAKASTISLEEGSDPMILIAAKLAAGNAGLGGVYALVPVSSATSTKMAPIADVIGETAMPARLMRSLGEEYMIGAYTFDTQSPFLIITNTFFQNAFAGMLEWEKDLYRDLLPLIRVAHQSETGSFLTAPFEDAVVSNMDTRVLRNDEGIVILAYTFADKDTVVIATGTETLKYLLDKLLSVRTIQ